MYSLNMAGNKHSLRQTVKEDKLDNYAMKNGPQCYPQEESTKQSNTLIYGSSPYHPDGRSETEKKLRAGTVEGVQGMGSVHFA